MSSPPDTPAAASATETKFLVTDKGTFSLGPSIGKGGFGTVYQGLHQEGGTFVAIKQLKLTAVPKAELGGIMAEIELLRSLDHPNIVRYITYLATADCLSIVMEYVENGSLLRIMKKCGCCSILFPFVSFDSLYDRRMCVCVCAHTRMHRFGKFPETLVAVYISQVLEGLAYLHDQGVIHRDIGANILVTKTGAVKIADFGIAATITQQENMDVMGTPYWMAPEIIELNGATSKSDIWSVACTVIELLTGQPPYFELAAMPALFRIVQDDNPPLPEAVSSTCRDWLLSAFKKDPDQRPSARKLFNHKWLRDARATQEKSKRNLGLEDAKKMVDDAEASRERRRAVNRARQDSTDESQPQPQPTQSIAGVEKKALQLVAELTATPDEAPDFDLDGLDLGPVEAPRPLQLPGSATGTPTKKPTAPLAAVESFDDDFGGDLADLKLPGEGPASPTKAKQPTADWRPAENNWTDEFDLPDGSLRLKISPFKAEATKAKPALMVTPPPTPIKKQQQQPSQSDSDDSWANAFDIPDGSLKLKPQKPSGHSPVPAFKGPSPLGGPMKTRPHADSLAIEDIDTEVKPKSSTQRIPLGRKSSAQVVSKAAMTKNFLATLEAAAKDPAPRKEGDEDTWSEFDFAALSGKKEDGGVLQLQLRNTGRQSSSGMSDDEDEPEWGDDDDDEDEEVIQRREDQAILQSELTSAFAAISKKGAKSADIIAALDKLCAAIAERESVKERAMGQVGAAALVDLLEKSHDHNVIQKALQTVNRLIKDNAEVQRIFALAGGFSTVIVFGAPTYSCAIRAEVGDFVSFMVGPSLETFVACKGPQALVGMLIRDGDTAAAAAAARQKLTQSALTAINSVLDLQKGKQFFDLSHTFLRSGLLSALVATARGMITDTEICGTIGSVFLAMAGTDDAAKGQLCVTEVLSGIWDLIGKGPENLRVALLKTVKLAASCPDNIEALHKSGAIRILVAEIPRNASAKYHVLVALSQICKLNPERQAEAAACGVVPHLLAAAAVRTLKDVALPMLCDLLRVKKARDVFWKNDCLTFFLDLLRDRIYQPNALDSIAWWLNDEYKKVKKTLDHGKEIRKLGRAFEKADNAVWPRLVGPYLRIVNKSRGISRKLCKEESFVRTVIAKLGSGSAKPEDKRTLVTILARLFKVCKEKKAFVTEFELVAKLTSIRKENQSTLIVVSIIDELLTEITK